MANRLLAACVVALLLACESEDPAPEAEVQTHEAAVRQGEEDLRSTMERLRTVAAAAEAVTMYRIANQFDSDFAQWKAKPKFLSYPVLARKNVSTQQAAPLLKVLTTRSAYLPPGEAWTCLFQPHHAVRWTSGKDTVTAVICLECGDIELYVGEKPIGTWSVQPAVNAELTRLLDT